MAFSYVTYPKVTGVLGHLETYNQDLKDAHKFRVLKDLIKKYSIEIPIIESQKKIIIENISQIQKTNLTIKIQNISNESIQKSNEVKTLNSSNKKIPIKEKPITNNSQNNTIIYLVIIFLGIIFIFLIFIVILIKKNKEK